MRHNVQMFVNLPVKDLAASIEFFTNLGFKFNPQFTNEKAACVIVGSDSNVMLLAEPFFRTFTSKKPADARNTAEVIVAISVESREMVDGIVGKALGMGAKPSKAPTDYGWMYGRSFQDLDSHLWEVIYMDPDRIHGGSK